MIIVFIVMDSWTPAAGGGTAGSGTGTGGLGTGRGRGGGGSPAPSTVPRRLDAARAGGGQSVASGVSRIILSCGLLSLDESIGHFLFLCRVQFHSVSSD